MLHVCVCVQFCREGIGMLGLPLFSKTKKGRNCSLSQQEIEYHLSYDCVRQQFEAKPLVLCLISSNMRKKQTCSKHFLIIHQVDVRLHAKEKKHILTENCVVHIFHWFHQQEAYHDNSFKLLCYYSFNNYQIIRIFNEFGSTILHLCVVL